jgi:long-chain acyl-CoA synthetase
MLGYLDDAQQDAFRGGAFRSGDLGYFKEIEGERFFYISGRLKDVIKRSGQTISLREVDAALAEIKLNQLDAVSFSYPDPIVGEELAIIFRFAPECDPSEQILEREFLLHAKTYFGRETWPRILFYTSDDLRTPSGKPRRADMRRRFDRIARDLVLPLGTDKTTIMRLPDDADTSQESQ